MSQPELFNPYGMYQGSFLPNCLLRYSELSSNDKLVWGRLVQYAGRDGECYPKQSLIAEELGISERTVNQSIRNLEDQEFILIESATGVDRFTRRNNVYRFIKHPIFNDGAYAKFASARQQDLRPEISKTQVSNKEESKSSLSQLGVATPSDDKNKRYLSFAERLDEILQSHGKKKQTAATLKSWSNDFRKLHTVDGVGVTELNSVLDWYSKYIGDEYVPEAFCGKTFRSKFQKLQSAIQRSKRPQRGQSIKPGHVAKDQTYSEFHKRGRVIDNSDI